MRVFFKREVLGEDTEEICNDERISASNCWVILHRARELPAARMRALRRHLGLCAM